MSETSEVTEDILLDTSDSSMRSDPTTQSIALAKDMFELADLEASFHQPGARFRVRFPGHYPNVTVRQLAKSLKAMNDPAVSTYAEFEIVIPFSHVQFIRR